MRQKIVFYGNCQGGAFKNLLDSTEVFQKYFDILNIPVHSIKSSEVHEVVEKVKQSKYFIYQPVGNYKGFQELSSNYLQKLLSSQAQAISFPSIYFNGYTPYAVHLRKKDGSRFPSLQKDSNMHDRNLLIAFYEGKTVDQTYEMITQKNFYSQELSLKLCNDSIKELERREKEQELDIVVSDLIKENYQDSLLFNTVNHPTTALLKQVAIKIAHKIGIDINERQKSVLPNILKSFSLFIYPSTHINLELKFPYQDYYKFNNSNLSIKKSIEQFFALYQSNQDEIEYTISGIKAHDFVTKTFALDLYEFIDRANKEIDGSRNDELLEQLERGQISRKQYLQSLYSNLNINIKSQHQILFNNQKMIKIIDQRSLYEIEIKPLKIEIFGCLENFVDNIKNKSVIKYPVNLDFHLVALFKDHTITKFELKSSENSLFPIKIEPKVYKSEALNSKYSNVIWSKYSRYHFSNIIINSINSNSSVYYIGATLSNGDSLNLVKIVLNYIGEIQQDIPQDNVIKKTKTIHRYIPKKKAFLEIKVIPKEAKLLELMSTSNIEEVIKLIYRNIVSKGDIVIDGGAHVGLHTFTLSNLCGANGSVHAFEVIPSKVKLLKSKISANSKFNNIILHTKALSNTSGINHEFHHIVKKPGLSGLIKDKNKIKNNDEVEVIQVETITIDKIIPEEKVKFIKLDIEGAELFALQGASKLLKRSECMVIFENGREKTADVYGYNKHDFFDFFAQINYQVFDLFGNILNQDLWDSKVNYIPWYFIAVPKGSYLKNFVTTQLPEFLDSYLIKQIS